MEHNRFTGLFAIINPDTKSQEGSIAEQHEAGYAARYISRLEELTAPDQKGDHSHGHAPHPGRHLGFHRNSGE